MFMTTQPWQQDEDYRKLIQNLEPPPPPGNDNAWELHFCKWWGWNWVKKKEVIEEAPMQKSVAHKLLETKKPEKKPVKHLCQSLCFKKKKDKKLQERYNTPSHSIIENTKKSPANCLTQDDNRKIQDIQDKIFSDKYAGNQRSDSIVEREIEALITKEVQKEVYAVPDVPKKKKRESKEWSTSSEEYCCRCCRYKDRSSTDESVECINITCCSCCPPKELSSTKKNTDEKYTQDNQPESKIIATQTEECPEKRREKRHRRKRICVVCCCRCKQNQPSCCACCSCSSIGKVEGKMDKKPETYVERESAPRRSPAEPSYSGKPPVTNYTTNQPAKKPTKHPHHLTQRFEPLYMTGMPIDTMLYHNKPITKFGIPSQSYSWIHATKSDIWDQFSHSRMSHELSNSVSGKSYVPPLKLPDVDTGPSTLFNPLSVDKELENLKKIETDIKMDLKSRIMLDAVCDAILAKDKEPNDSSSIFLNEFTYPSNVAQTEINDICKSEQKNMCSKLNQTRLEEIIFEDVTNKPYENKVNCETNTSSLNLNVLNRENTSLRDYINVRSPQIYATDNLYRRPLRNRCIPFNYNMHRERVTLNENKYPRKLIDYAVTNNRPLIPTQRQPTFTVTKLVPTSKRCASPSPRTRDIKKVKLGDPSALMNFKNTNVSDIFKKIDEIILRSKVNNEEIQTVLSNIPKRSYKFFTSWEVSNLINQDPPLEFIDPGGKVNSCVNTTIEDKKEKNDKARAPQSKKKKIGTRPSMIPKRVADLKLNKRNVDL